MSPQHLTAPKPDVLDLALLEELQHDGRATYEALARAVGLSRPASAARLRRLLDSGVVTVVGVVHPSVFGLTAYAHAAVSVQGRVTPVAEEIATFADVPFLSVVAGRFSLVAELRCADQHALAAAIRRIAAVSGVRRVETTIYTEILKDTHFPPGPYSATAIDEVDRALLALLQRDGRAAFSDLADAVGLSTSAARARVLRLLECGAVHIGARVNANALGVAQHTGFEVTFTQDAGKAVEAILRMRQVQYFATSVGRCDAVGTAVGYSPEDTLRVLDEIRATPGVRFIECWTHLNIRKESYELAAGPPLTGAGPAGTVT
jgi:DNA-binding Lrp family transcriptional regulator